MKTMGYAAYIKATRKVIERTKDKRPEFAVVKSIDGVRVDLAIGQSQAITRNVEVIGDSGQLAIGDTVQISWWDGDRPVAIAGTNLSDITERMGAAEDKLAGINIIRPVSSPNNTGGIADWQILHFSKGALASVHQPDTSGMNDALSVCAPGDNILIPTIELVMDFTIPQDVTVTGISRFGVVIKGCVTLSEGSALETLRVFNQQDTEDNIAAVKGPSGGKARINNCDIWAWNCGTGEAVGILSEEAGTTYAQKSYISGESRYHHGMAVKIVAGDVRLEDCKEYGDMDNSGDVKVYNVFDGETEIVCPEIPSTASIYRNALGNSSIQFDPEYAYALPISISQSTIAGMYPILYSTNYVFGIGIVDDNAPMTIRRLAIADGTVVTLGSFGEYDNTDFYPLVTAIDDNTVYAAYYEYSVGWHIYKADFAANTFSEIATWEDEMSGYSYVRTRFASYTVGGVTRLTLFGLVSFEDLDGIFNATRFFYRTYTVGTGWGTSHVEYLSSISGLNDYAAWGLSRCVGAMTGSRLIAVAVQENADNNEISGYETQPRICTFFDIDVVTDAFTRVVYQTLADPYVNTVGINMLQISGDLVLCSGGLYVPLYFPGEYQTKWFRYDLSSKAVAYDENIIHNSYGATDGTNFYFAHGNSYPNYTLYNSQGNPLFNINMTSWRSLAPCIVDGRALVYDDANHILRGYLLTNGDDIMTLDLLSTGTYNTLHIQAGYLIHEARTSGETTYYLDRGA